MLTRQAYHLDCGRMEVGKQLSETHQDLTGQFNKPVSSQEAISEGMAQGRTTLIPKSLTLSALRTSGLSHALKQFTSTSQSHYPKK